MKSIARIWQLSSSDGSENEQPPGAFKANPRNEDDFQYTVEVFTGNVIEQTLAITISRGVAFAAYYTALEQLSDRSIRLRHKDVVLAHYNARKH